MTTLKDSQTADYSALPSNGESVDDMEMTATAVDLSPLYADRPVKAPDQALYTDLPEARNLTWEDTFFDDDDDVLAVFDFDYDSMESYYTSVGWACLGASAIYPPLLAIGLLSLTPCYLQQNVQWDARCQHVAVTRDGIRYVRDRRRSCWGLACTDRGKSSKTVPFDKITDCDVEEPAGNTCICVPKVLNVVNIDTASSGTEGKKELKLAGLKEPFAFKKLVWAMKRQQCGLNGGASNSLTQGDKANEDVTALLKEIRDELRTNNELIRNGNHSDPSPVSHPVATPIEEQLPQLI